MAKWIGGVAAVAMAVAGCGGSAAKPAATAAGEPATGGAAGGTATAAGAEVEKAPRLEGMGKFAWTVTTSSPEAQRFFDQGMVLAFGFNHAEAGRAFRYAAALDPACAMCWWGAALVLGPNINAKMEATDAPKAWAALEKATALAPKATTREQQYIAALGTRYAASAPADRAALDVAFAEAQCAMADGDPTDVNALVLCAEARMDLHPWDYWKKDGTAQAWTPAILAGLEKAMAAAPEHPGANHLYIHALEASREPGKATAAAERLASLAPGAGHLVHMPSHIYIRTGRYAEAAAANERAIEVDEAYVAQCREQGIYPLAYKPHNWHFLWASATLQGRYRRALEAAAVLAERTPDDKMGCHGLGTLQHYKITPLYAFVRFGKWTEILEFAEPALPYPKAVWRYARATARVFTGDLAAAEAELAALRLLAADPALADVTIWDINTTKALIAVAVAVVEGELAARRKQWKPAIAHLERALTLEGGLNYNEPADWSIPVRHLLGAVYLEAGRPRDAERVYRADLAELPENGFALFGLRQALAARGQRKAAADVDARFKASWKDADHMLMSSRF